MTRCPFCPSTTDYTRLSAHWTQNSACPGPTLSAEQVGLTAGLMLSGAHVYRRGDNRHGAIQVTSTQRAFIEWLHRKYGVLSDDTIQTRDARSVIESFGHEGQQARENVRAQYRMRTFAAAPFDAFEGRREYRLTRPAVRVWFARRGVTRRTGSGSYRLHLSTASLPDDVDWAARLTAYFPAAWRTHTDATTPTVVLYRKADVERFLAAHSPVPGYTWRWDPSQHKP